MPGKAPNIIFTIKFSRASSRYLSYTERKEAVKNEQADPIKIEEDKELDGYLGYTDREAATLLEHDADGYPTFNDQSLNLNEAQHDELKDKLKEASDRGAVMWAGVVSFNPDFLKSSGVLSADGKEVNQPAIKRAIQQAMPGLLRNEQLNSPNTFWWGDVHLNTDHVHVHLTISQTKNTREVRDGQIVGAFHHKTFRQFKSQVEHALMSERERNVERENQVRITRLKGDLKDQVINEINLDSHQKQLLGIWQSLPNYRDQRYWRASNHSKRFKQSQALVNQLVDQMLKGPLKDDYQAYYQSLVKRDQLSRARYGQKIKDTVWKNDRALRDYLANRIYDHFREVNEQFTETKLIDRMQAVDLETNNQILDQKVKELKELEKADPEGKSAALWTLRRENGLRRNYIRQQNLKLANQNLTKLEAKLSKFPVTPAQKFILRRVKEEQEYNKLRYTPKWERAKHEGAEERLKQLTGQYIDPRNSSISKVTPEVAKQRIQSLDQLIKVIEHDPSDPAVKAVLPVQSKQGIAHVVRYYRAQQRLLANKATIHENNRKYKDNDEQKKTANRTYFAENALITNQYLDDPQKISEQLEQTALANDKLTERINALKRLPKSPTRNYFLKQLREQRLFNRLNNMPRWQRQMVPGREEYYQQLRLKHIQVTKVGDWSATSQLVAARKHNLKRTIEVIKQNPTDPAIKIMTPDDLDFGTDQLVAYYQTQRKYLDIQAQIRDNKVKYKDEDELKKANGRLYASSMQAKKEMEKVELIDNWVAKLKQANQGLPERQAALEKLPQGPIRDYFLKQVREQQEYNRLKFMPWWQRGKNTPLDKRLQELKLRYIDPRTMWPNDATPELVKTRTDEIAKVIGLMGKYPRDPAVKIMLPNPDSSYGVSNAIRYFHAQQQLLQLNGQIYLNNQKYPDDKDKQKEVNKRYYAQRFKYMALIDDGKLIDHQLDQELKDKLREKVDKVGRKARIGQQMNKFIGQLGKGLQAAQQEGRTRTQALKKRLDGEIDEFEEMDREESQGLER